MNGKIHPAGKDQFLFVLKSSAGHGETGQSTTDSIYQGLRAREKRQPRRRQFEVASVPNDLGGAEVARTGSGHPPNGV